MAPGTRPCWLMDHWWTPTSPLLVWLSHQRTLWRSGGLLRLKECRHPYILRAGGHLGLASTRRVATKRHKAAPDHLLSKHLQCLTLLLHLLSPLLHLSCPLPQLQSPMLQLQPPLWQLQAQLLQLQPLLWQLQSPLLQLQSPGLRNPSLLPPLLMLTKVSFASSYSRLAFAGSCKIGCSKRSLPKLCNMWTDGLSILQAVEMQHMRTQGTRSSSGIKT